MRTTRQQMHSPSSPSRPCSPTSTPWKAENFKVFRHHRNLPHPKQALAYMQAHSIAPDSHHQFYLKFSNSTLLHLFHALFFTLSSPLTPSTLRQAPLLQEYLAKLGAAPVVRIVSDPIGQFQSFAESYREWLNTNTAELLRELEENKALIREVYENGLGSQLSTDRVRVDVARCDDYSIICYYVRKDKPKLIQFAGYLLKIFLTTVLTLWTVFIEKFRASYTRTKAWIS